MSVLYFEKKIKVESSAESSAQAKVFFGREADLNFRVVLKQYKLNLKGMFREIKIFTELERRKNNEENKEPFKEESSQSAIGLPHLLSYAIATNNRVGEILMTNEGQNLKYWQKKITDKGSRMLFALSMIYQVTKGLQTIHGF